MKWHISKSTSVRGIKRNLVRNELTSNRSRHYNGRELSISDREKFKKIKLGKRQSIFGALFKQHKTQAR